MCGGRSSILHFGPLYALTPNGQSQNASLNKSNTPPSEITVYQYQIMAISESQMRSSVEQ